MAADRAAQVAIVHPQDEPTDREWVRKRMPLLSREKWRVVSGPQIGGAHYASADGLSAVSASCTTLPGIDFGAHLCP